jgi:hypothetical protein
MRSTRLSLGIGILAVILFASLAAAAVVHVTKGWLPLKTGSDVSTLISRESAVQSDLRAFKKLGAKASVSGWESKLKAAESAQSSAIATLNADLGVTGTNAVAACNTDVKTVEIGVQAYEADATIDPTAVPPPSISSLLASGPNGANAPLLSWPSNYAYYYVGLATSATTIHYINASGTETALAGFIGLTPGQVNVDAGNPPPPPATVANWHNYNSYVTTRGGNICSLN